jgi:hypothetical protein
MARLDAAAGDQNRAAFLDMIVVSDDRGAIAREKR